MQPLYAGLFPPIGKNGRSIRELHLELRQFEQRLGTAAEMPGDLDRARALAHEINNRIQAGYLRAAMRMIDETGRVA